MKKSKLFFCVLVFLFAGLSNLSFAQSKTGENLPSWINLGPDNISGRVTSIIFDKYNDGVLYAGTAGGGLFISVNNGHNWKEIDIKDASFAVTTITQNEEGYVYIGTGENKYGDAFYGKNNQLCQLIGSGVFKMNNFASPKNWVADLTSDEAKYQFVKDHISFSVIPSTKPDAYDESHDWAYVNSLLFSGSDLYASTKTGLWKLDTGGSTWQKISIASTNSFEGLDLIASSRGDIAVVYFTVAQGFQVALKKAGQNAFANIFTKQSASSADALAHIKIAFAPSNPDVIYTLLAGKTYRENAKVFRSTNLGTSWALNTRPDFHVVNKETEMAIAVSPEDDKNIFVGGRIIMQGEDANNTDLFYWNSKSEGMGVAHTSPSYVHEGIHCITFHPNPKTGLDSNLIFVGTNGGIHKSPSKGNSWTLASKGLNSVQFYSVAVSPDGSVVGGTKSNGSVIIKKGAQFGDNRYGESIWTPWREDGGGLLFTNPLNLFSDLDAGGAEASAFQRDKPSMRQPLFLSSPYNGLAKTYGDNGQFGKVNQQTWFYRSAYLPDAYFTPSFEDPWITPTLLWETLTDKRIKDSVLVRLDTNTMIRGSIKSFLRRGQVIPAGDSVRAISRNIGYPFWHVFQSAFSFNNDTVISVKTPIHSRYFFGNNRGVWMTDQGLDFLKSPSRTFLVFRLDTAIQNQKVRCLSISKDGNSLFVAVDQSTGSSKLFRIDNLIDGTPSNDRTMSYAVRDQEDNVLVSSEIGSFNRQISSIVVDEDNPNRVLLAFDGYNPAQPNLMISTNAQAAATSVVFNELTSTGIPRVLPVFSLLQQSFDNGKKKHAFLGSEDGVYKTLDITASPVKWERVKDAPSVPIFQIKQQRQNLPEMHNTVSLAGNPEAYLFKSTESPGAIYFATYGKGIWMNTEYVGENPPPVVGLSDVKQNPSAIALRMYPNPTNQKSTIDFTISKSSSIIIRSFDMNGRMIHNMDLGRRSAGNFQEELDFKNAPKGVYVIQVISNRESNFAKLVIQ